MMECYLIHDQQRLNELSLGKIISDITEFDSHQNFKIVAYLIHFYSQDFFDVALLIETEHEFCKYYRYKNFECYKDRIMEPSYEFGIVDIHFELFEKLKSFYFKSIKTEVSH